MNKSADQPANSKAHKVNNRETIEEYNSFKKNKKIKFNLKLLPLIFLLMLGVLIYFTFKAAYEKSTYKKSRAAIEKNDIRLSLLASDITIDKNESFTVSVLGTIQKLLPDPFHVGSLSFSLQFPSDLVEFENYTPGNFFSTMVPPGTQTEKLNFSQTETSGNNQILTIALGAHCTIQTPWECYPADQSNTLAILNFKAKNTSGNAKIFLIEDSIEAAQTDNCNPDTPEGILICSKDVGYPGSPADIDFTIGAIDSPTPTPTPDPNSVNPSIKVKFQSIISAKPPITVRVKLFDNNDVPVFESETELTSDAGGIYTGTVNNVPRGDYNLIIKSSIHLSRKFENIAINNNDEIDLTIKPLFTGDIICLNPCSDPVYKDNKINILDLGKILQDYSSTVPIQSIADINFDGLVNSEDLSPALDNYWKEGE